MTLFGLHWIDGAILVAYFLIIFYVGVVQGARQTRTMGDFLVGGGRWGHIASFIFVFASALAGTEAVVVAGEAYKSGLAGVWYWWSFLFATPVYFLFATHYRRARVRNLAEFIEMRYEGRVAVLYALLAASLCILGTGGVLLAIGKLLAGLTELSTMWCVLLIAGAVAAYTYAGGMVSAVLTDLVQGVMCLLLLSFVILPFLWSHAGGFDALRALPVETWNLTAPGMTIWTIAALNASALMGGIASPWIYNWIAISKNEAASTHCGWAHLWKRLITLLFAFYGILFAVVAPGLADPEMAWGMVMSDILPVGAIGLLVASFFAAAMSSADTLAITASGMLVDYLYRRVLHPGASARHYLNAARSGTTASIALATVSTFYIDTIADYVQLTLSLLGFLGIPIYFAVYWRRANRLGMWLALGFGAASYLVIMVLLTGPEGVFPTVTEAFPWGVFVPAALSLMGMYVGSVLGRPEDEIRVLRFHTILNTPIGREARLVEAGIVLPELVDAGLVEDQPERLNLTVLERLHRSDSADKVFGASSGLELRREPSLAWYFPGLAIIILSCIALVVGTWLLVRVVFVWT